MDRKQFLISSSLTVMAMSVYGSIVNLPNGKFEGDCETTNDILGPFYRPNAPFRNDLTFENLDGTRIDLQGTIFKSDCVTPLKDALVEIWHCNSYGEYDNDSYEFLHRASLITDETGSYSFKTILPGKYLNGRLYRPAHIHYRVTHQNSKELISQMYFKGDPHIEEDPWASQEKAKLRIVDLIPEDINGNLNVNFDIQLAQV